MYTVYSAATSALVRSVLLISFFMEKKQYYYAKDMLQVILFQIK